MTCRGCNAEGECSRCFGCGVALCSACGAAACGPGCPGCGAGRTASGKPEAQPLSVEELAAMERRITGRPVAPPEPDRRMEAIERMQAMLADAKAREKRVKRG